MAERSHAVGRRATKGTSFRSKSRLATVALFLLAFLAWFVPFLWVAFHDTGVTIRGTDRPRRSSLRAALRTIVDLF